MENNNLTDHIIDDFILGLLSEEENIKIRTQLEGDLALAKEIELRREIILGLEAFGRKSLKDDLKNIHAEVVEESKTPAKRRSLFPYIAAAASILILIIALNWLLKGNGEINTKDLYASNFEQYELSLNQRDAAKEDILQIEGLYSAEKYKEVLPLLETQLAANESKPSNLLLATGITHLELNAPQKALLYFDQILKKGDFNFEDEVNWYSALAYLKSNDLESTRQKLKPLVQDSKADHHQAATVLLEAISD